jgi:hypothetical protein
VAIKHLRVLDHSVYENYQTNIYLYGLYSHIHFLLLRSFIQGICSSMRLLVNFHNKLIFYSKELLAPCPTPKLEDHPLLAVCDCLFNIFAATLHIWMSSPPSTTWGICHAVLNDHFTVCESILFQEASLRISMENDPTLSRPWMLESAVIHFSDQKYQGQWHI